MGPLLVLEGLPGHLGPLLVLGGLPRCLGPLGIVGGHLPSWFWGGTPNIWLPLGFWGATCPPISGSPTRGSSRGGPPAASLPLHPRYLGPPPSILGVSRGSPTQDVCLSSPPHPPGLTLKPPKYQEHDFRSAPQFLTPLVDRSAVAGYTTALNCAVRGHPKVGGGKFGVPLTNPPPTQGGGDEEKSLGVWGGYFWGALMLPPPPLSAR